MLTAEASRLVPLAAIGRGNMPLTFDYDKENRMLMGLARGRLCFEDFYQGLLPDYPMGTTELLDLRDVTEMDITGDQIRSIANLERKGPNRISRMAILVGSEVGFGLSRMFQAHAAEVSYEIQVFRDLDEAQKWLRS